MLVCSNSISLLIHLLIPIIFQNNSTHSASWAWWEWVMWSLVWPICQISTKAISLIYTAFYSHSYDWLKYWLSYKALNLLPLSIWISYIEFNTLYEEIYYVVYSTFWSLVGVGVWCVEENGRISFKVFEARKRFENFLSIFSDLYK